VNPVRLFRTILLAGFLFITPSFAQAPATPAPQAQVFELNAGLCGSSSLGVFHVEMDGKKIVFDYYLNEKREVVKDDDPLVIDYAEEPAVDGGAIPFKGSFTLEGKDYKVVGMKYKDRVAAVVLKDGDVLYIFYGVGGPREDLPKVQEAATGTCIYFLSSDDLAKSIVAFLQGADKKEVAPEDPNTSKT
jgi:hypothetical protein